jgi:hypothetical protein
MLNMSQFVAQALCVPMFFYNPEAVGHRALALRTPCFFSVFEALSRQKKQHF